MGVPGLDEKIHERQMALCGGSIGLARPLGRSKLSYRVGRDQRFGETGLPNFAASIGTFSCTSLSSKESRPSSHAKVQRNGILIPLTSR